MLPVIKKIWTSDVTELTDRLKRIKSSDRGRADCFIFKVSLELLEEIENDERARLEINARAQGKPVFVIRYDESRVEFVIYMVERAGLNAQNDLGLLQSVREYDLKEVIFRTDGDCILEAPDNVHFITPSQKHTTRFLRLTDALYSYNALDRVSFWLQPFIAMASAVVVDTWSLSSIVLRAQQILKVDIPFDCFHEHIKGNRDLALKTLNKLSRRIESERPILFLVSISSSGTFLKELPSLLRESNITNDFEVLSVYKFRNTPASVSALAQLDLEIEWYEEEDCAYCNGNERNTAYEIDPKYYYPRKYQETAVRFTRDLLEEEDHKRSAASEFIHKYGSHNGVLVVHKDDPNDGITPRHHAFYVDVSRLMQIEDFVLEFEKKVAEIEKYNGIPDVVVTPPHDAATVIVRHLSRRWENARYLSHHNLRGIKPEEKVWIKEARHICFVDDVTITGTRIAEYLRTLREDFGHKQLSSLESITWFPLIARASNPKGIARIKDSISNHPQWKNYLTYVHDLVLPDWSGEGECPWCQEEALYERTVGAMWDEPQWYEKRRAWLRNRKQGIAEQPLLVRPFAEPCTLGGGSPLGDQGLNEMQILYLLSSGLQQLRHRSSSPLGRDDLFHRYVLFWDGHDDKKCNTFVRFSEPLIQSAFLRVVKTNEWSRTLKQLSTSFLSSRIKSGTCDGLIGEGIIFLLKSGYRNVLPDSMVNRVRKLAEPPRVSRRLFGLSQAAIAS